MAANGCNKFLKTDNGEKKSVVCFNCGNSNIYSNDTLYCSCCGSPLAVLGLPKAGQVEISSKLKKLTTKLFNAGSIPLNISFDINSFPNGLDIKPFEATIKPGYPVLLNLSSDGYLFKQAGSSEEFLPSQEFTIEFNEDALKEAKNNGIKIPIKTNAKLTNQKNLDTNPYLFIPPKGSENDENDEADEDSSSNDNTDTLTIDEKIEYTVTEYKKDATPKEIEVKIGYKNNSRQIVQITSNNDNRVSSIKQADNYYIHGKQNGSILLKLNLDDNNDDKKEIPISILATFGKDKTQLSYDRTIIVKNNCRTYFVVNDDSKKFENKIVEFEKLILPNQISYTKTNVKVCNSKEEFKITKIEYSNDLVKVLNSQELIGKIIKPDEKDKLEIKLVFSTRWAKKNNYFFFEGNNSFNGRITIHTNLISNAKINIDWHANVQGLSTKLENDILALDFGTVNSCVAIYDNNEQTAKIVDINYSEDSKSNNGIVPSALAFFDEDVFVVGKVAQDELRDVSDSSNSKNVVVSIKRCITGEDREFFNKEYTPVKIASLMMEQMILKAVARLGRYPKHIVLTIPANFRGTLREKIIEAFRKACSWNDNPSLIDEPTAAAINYMKDEEIDKRLVGKKSNMLVFDFGGGTLDVSILEVDKTDNSTKVQPLISRGDNELGGIDLDYALIQYVVGRTFNEDDFEYKALYPKKAKFIEFMKDYNEDLVGHIKSCRAQLSLITEVKESLSENNEYEKKFEFDSYNKEDKKNEITIDKITKEAFEKAISKRLERIKKFVENCIKSAKLQPNEINFLLLTGQSSRIPIIKEKLTEIFPKNTVTFINDEKSDEIKTCVAKGAALATFNIKWSSDFKINNLDKTSYRYGYVTAKFPNQEFHCLIENGVHFSEAVGEAEINPIDTLEIVQHEGCEEDDVFNGEDRKYKGVVSIGYIDLTDSSLQLNENGKYHIKLYFDRESANKLIVEVNGKLVKIDEKKSLDSIANTYI